MRRAGSRQRGLFRLRAQSCVLGLLTAVGLTLGGQSALADKAFPKAPKFVAPKADEIPKGTRVDVIASKLTYDGKTEIATAIGTVELTYGPYVLTATKVVYNMKSGKFSANGSIVLKEPNGNVLEADMAELTDKFKEGFARHVRALLTNDVTITADYAQRFENGVTIYERATYTACKDCVSAGGTPAWQIAAKQVKHDLDSHTLYYRNATLEFGGVPVLWTPYFEYPDPTVKRRTGFLLPNFHGGGTYGFGVTTPYFINLAPDKDVTLSPMWSTKQGVLADAEYRQRTRSGQFSVRGYGIHELDPGESDASDGPWRGAVRTKGRFAITDTWNWGWDGTLASDRGFLSDYDLDNRDMAMSYVQTTRLSDRDYAKAQVINWRTLTQDEEQDYLPSALPFITANYIFDQPVMGGEVSFDMNAYSLRREDPDPRYGLGTEQSHLMTRMRWDRQMATGMGLLMRPFAELRSDVVTAQNVPGKPEQDDAQADLLPSGGFDMRLPMVASNDFGQSVLTPVFQIIAAPSEPDYGDTANEDAITMNFDATNLFLSDRFSGFDRYEGGVRANAGVSYTLMGDNGGFLRASLGESFHIAGENSFAVGSGLDGTSSDLVGAVALQLTDYLTLGYQARVEEDLSRINVQEATAGLTFDSFSGSLSYADIAAAANYGRPDHEQQVWGDAKYMLDQSWSVFGAFRYDIEGNHFMEQSIGVGYECDCMTAHLTYSQNREDDGGTDHRIELGVELRTIGGVDGGFKL